MASILTFLLINVYDFLYRPESITDIFVEFDKYIWSVYTNAHFYNVMTAGEIIGVGLLVTSCIISLMDTVTDGDFTINNLFRHLLKYFMLYVILINARVIFGNLLQWTTAVFTDMNSMITSAIQGQEGVEINAVNMQNAISDHLGFGSKLGLFIQLAIPYAISIIFTIVICFFACSRLFEAVIRITLAPLVVGVSFFGSGTNSDIVRYAKRTLGVFFQIIVILVVSAGVTLTHNSLIAAESNQDNGQEIINPANNLELQDGYIEIYKEGEWHYAANPPQETELPEEHLAYTRESTYDFIYSLTDPSYYFVSTGIMIAALFMIFKSRQISTQLFM